MLKPLWQKDARWRNKFIGNTRLTIGKYGCLITALAILTWQRPDELNAKLTRNNCYNRKGELDCAQAAKTLSMSYEYTNIPPEIDCIFETNYYRAYGFPQHFAVWLFGPKKCILNPLTGKLQQNTYPIVSYRVFRSLHRQAELVLVGAGVEDEQV